MTKHPELTDESARGFYASITSTEVDAAQTDLMFSARMCIGDVTPERWVELGVKIAAFTAHCRELNEWMRAARAEALRLRSPQ